MFSILILGLLSCDRNEPEEVDTEGAAQTVILITIDTVKSSILHTEGWEVAPVITGFFDESAHFPSTVVTRGLTAPSLSSIITGLYPRDHGLRANGMGLIAPTIGSRFQELGYTTAGFSANQCGLMNNGFDVQLCAQRSQEGEDDPENQEDLDQTYNDLLLVQSLAEELPKLEADEKVFIWMHFNLPHSPY